MIGRVDRSPLIAAAIALLWLAASATASFPLLAAATVAGLILPACWAARRRKPPLRRGLLLGLSITGAALAAVLATLSPGHGWGPWVLAVEVLALSAGSLALPSLYAATFHRIRRKEP